MNKIKKIDDHVYLWYKKFNVKYYKDNAKQGVFYHKMQREQLNNEYDVNIETQLGLLAEPVDSLFHLYFDDTFPVPSDIKLTKNGHDLLIFYVLQHIYLYSDLPTNIYFRNKIVPRCDQYSNVFCKS